MGVWEAIEMLNTLIDDSDPDVATQIFCIDDVKFIRQACRKSTIFYRLRKLFEEMGNRSGCRFVILLLNVAYLYLGS